VTRSERLTGAVLGAVFLALHLPFLPPSLEDLDSINFALGIRYYDIAQHQPHPPGYPLFIGAAKLLAALGLSEVHALSLLGVHGLSQSWSGCQEDSNENCYPGNHLHIPPRQGRRTLGWSRQERRRFIARLPRPAMCPFCHSFAN